MAEYKDLFNTLDALCAGETDEVALMATIALAGFVVALNRREAVLV